MRTIGWTDTIGAPLFSSAGYVPTSLAPPTNLLNQVEGVASNELQALVEEGGRDGVTESLDQNTPEGTGATGRVSIPLTHMPSYAFTLGPNSDGGAVPQRLSWWGLPLTELPGAQLCSLPHQTCSCQQPVL